MRDACADLNMRNIQYRYYALPVALFNIAHFGVLSNIALNAFRHATLERLFFRLPSSDTRAMGRFADVVWYDLNRRIRSTPEPFLMFYLILR